MISLQVSDSVDPAAWDRDVIQLNGSPFHSHEWSQFTGKAHKSHPIYFRWTDESGDAQGLAIGYSTEVRVWGLPVNRELSLGSLPAVGGGLSLGTAAGAIRRYATEQTFTSLSMNSYGTPVESDVLLGFGLEVERRWEFLVSMEGTQEDLWNRIHTMKKRHIKKGQKEGLRVERATTVDSARRFRELMLETAERKIAAGIPFPKVGSQEYFHLLSTLLGETGLGRLYLTYDGEVPIAGAFLLGFNGTAYYMLSATSEVGQRKGAQDLNIWTCMSDCLQEDFRVFNLGGISERDVGDQPLEEAGLYLFKKRFSAEVLPCFKGKLVLRPLSQRLFWAAKKLRNRLG